MINFHTDGLEKDVVFKNWNFQACVLAQFHKYREQYGVKHGVYRAICYYPDNQDYYVKIRQTKNNIIVELKLL